jgi:hypothetical protein
MVDFRRIVGSSVLITALIFIGFWMNKIFGVDIYYLAVLLSIAGLIGLMVIFPPLSHKSYR